MLIKESMFWHFLILGLRTTIMKSYSAFGPNLSVILLVSSLDIGFSINHDSCLISLLTILSFVLIFYSAFYLNLYGITLAPSFDSTS
jgi:hypothetical protein